MGSPRFGLTAEFFIAMAAASCPVLALRSAEAEVQARRDVAAQTRRNGADLLAHTMDACADRLAESLPDLVRRCS